MVELKGKFSEVRSEKGAIPHLTLIIDVKNDSPEPAIVVLAAARVYAPTSPLGMGALVDSGFISAGFSPIQPLAAKESRKWWVTFALNRDERRFFGKVPKRSDLHLNIKIEVLTWEQKDDKASFRWVEVKDDTNSNFYVSVRIPKSDWEKVWDEISSDSPLFERLERATPERKFAQGIKEWWRGKYIQPSLGEIFGEEGPKERFQRPWPARVISAIWGFWCRHWQFIVATLITLIGVYVVYLTYLKA